MKFDIKPIIGENCITLEDGEKVYNIVLSALKDGNEIELDFSGVRIYASPFFNAAAGKLLNEYSSDELNKLVHFNGLSEHGKQVFERVIQNACKFYSNPKYRKAVEKMIIQQSEGCYFIFSRGES